MPAFWAVVWALILGQMVIGFLITSWYYDGTADDRRTERESHG